MEERGQSHQPETQDGHVLSEWMTQPALAQELGISVDTLQRWHNQRIGPPRAKIGARVMYRRAAVREWLVSQEEKSPAGVAK